MNAVAFTNSPLQRVQSIAIFVSVCLAVYVLEYHKNHLSELHEIFYTCYLWPWLSPPLMTMQCYISSGWRHVFT